MSFEQTVVVTNSLSATVTSSEIFARSKICDHVDQWEKEILQILTIASRQTIYACIFNVKYRDAIKTCSREHNNLKLFRNISIGSICDK